MIHMVHLLTVRSGFQARVIAARLGSEGIVTELRGGISGPYPVGDVGVYVGEGDLDLSRQLLLADEVEDAFTEATPDAGARRRVPAGVVVALLGLVWAVSLLVRWM
ncbi:MAG TPA: hypothetical protein VHN98_02855 [Acidimicrobiales bacterium]|nr:hypothetical protein [Acidimicrobiales bacterium]